MAKLDTGALWPNKYKRTARDPDLQGQINIDGKLVKIVAWYGDNPSISIRVNKGKPQEQHDTDTICKPHPMDNPPKDFDDDIPF